MPVCAIVFSAVRSQNCSWTCFWTENHVFRAILDYFSKKPFEPGKLPNVPSEIPLKLAFFQVFPSFHPSSPTCSQPGARTQVIVFMPVCMPVCAIVFSAVRRQNCSCSCFSTENHVFGTILGYFFKTPRTRKTAKRHFWNPTETKICKIFPSFQPK